MPIIKMFYDLETTGVDVSKHGIHQIAGLIEVDGEVVQTFNFKVRPLNRCELDPTALQVGRVTAEELKTYPPMRGVYLRLTSMLQDYVDRYNKRDKIFLVGYNNRGFDDPFLRKWFEDCGDKYFGSYFWSNSLDVMVLATEYLLSARKSMPSFKLHRVAQELGLEVDEERLHEAGYDVELTRSIYEFASDGF